MSDQKAVQREKKQVKILIARKSDNTYNDYIIPIIFLPGVMGSRLKFKSGNTWDPDDLPGNIWHWYKSDPEKQRIEMRCADFEDISYNAVMTEKPQKFAEFISDEEVKRGWAGVSYKFHGQFLQLGIQTYYSTHHHPIYGFGYDWRDSNSKSGLLLKDRISSILATHKASKCIIVTHSMGGLVTRAAIRQAQNPVGLAGPSPDLTDKVLAVVHICQPAVGTPVAYRRMFTGATFLYDGKSIEAHVFGTAVGNTGETFSQIVSGMDGPLQLLPTDGYPNVNGHPWLRYTTPELGDKIGSWGESVYASYLSKLQPPGISPENTTGARTVVKTELKQRLERAKAFHTALRENGKPFRHPLTFALYSRGLKIDVMTHFEKTGGIGGFIDRNNPFNYPVGNTGFVLKLTDEQQPEDGSDGTVAEHSATSLFPDQQQIPPPQKWQEVGSKGNEKDGGIRQYVFNGILHMDAANNLEINKAASVIIHRILRSFGKIPE
jgi:hypothetical protein